MKRKPNFSMVLIAKNEEKTLPKMLQSLQSFFQRGGEVVIVDTGSTDNTVQIAKDAGCVVYEAGDQFTTTISEDLASQINEKFSVDEGDLVKEGDRLFNFSAARNFAASLASNDMISNQDCDEEYTVLNIDAISKLIDEGHKQFEYNFVFSHDQFGNEAIKFTQSKFYDRRKLQWVGIVHEVLQIKDNEPIKRTFLDESIFKLEHWQNPETPRGHYLKGLAVDCFMNPNNDRNSHYFARELMYHKKPHSAIKEFKRHIAMNRWPAERAQSMIYIGDCFSQLNQPDQQREWYLKGFELDSGRREALIKLAYYYKFYNQPQKVACYVAAAMEIPWSGYYSNRREYYTNIPHELMYWAKGWMGKIDEAKYHICKALEYQPYNAQYLRDTKYYFEYPDNGLEGWMRFPELQWLYKISQSMSSIVEVGSWKGKSTHALCSGCKHGEVMAVDHFMGSDEPQHKGKADNDAIYEAFMENMKDFKNLTIYRTSSVLASEKFKDGSLDMVFLDGSHKYQDVVDDITWWKNKAKYILCGHDYTNVWPEVKQAVIDTLGEVETVDTIWYKILQPLPDGYPKIGKTIDLRDKIPNAKSIKVLNLGCGNGNSGLGIQLPFFRFKKITNLDCYLPFVEQIQKLNWRAKNVEFIIGDIMCLNTSFSNFDLILVFDVLEHLNKDDALELLTKIKKSSADLLMFVPQEDVTKSKYNNPSGIESMEHKSYWTTKEFINLGLKVEVIKNFNYGPFVADALWVTKGE